MVSVDTNGNQCTRCDQFSERLFHWEFLAHPKDGGQKVSSHDLCADCQQEWIDCLVNPRPPLPPGIHEQINVKVYRHGINTIQIYLNETEITPGPVSLPTTEFIQFDIDADWKDKGPPKLDYGNQ